MKAVRLNGYWHVKFKTAAGKWGRLSTHLPLHAALIRPGLWPSPPRWSAIAC
jgi:hypothetical protein